MPANSKRIYLSPPHMSGKELGYINDAFASNWIAPVGPNVDDFEKEFCTIVKVPFAAAVSSGTAALHLALNILGIGENDEVLCSSFTFAGSANPIVYQKATPVFVDSNAASWGIDPQLLEDAIKDRLLKGKRPKAVIVVHLYGQCADMDPIVDICNKYDLWLIEDAAESLGSTYKNKHSGTIGRIGIFSFNGNKIITTSGGGMLVSSDKLLVDKARFLATQARDPAPHYEHSTIGYNYRMSNILAGIGRGQLTVLDKRVERKREIFDRYRERLAHIDGVDFMPEPAYGKSNRWLTCITINPAKIRVSCETIRNAFEAENIECRPLWKPMHLQPVFAQCPSFTNGVSQTLFETGLCLPSGTAMTDEEFERVISCFSNVIKL